MKATFRFIVLILLLAGWSLAALSLHVVRADGPRVIVLPKQSLDWRDIYVDTRNWTLDDVASHPAVVNRLIQNGKADVLQRLVPGATGDALAAQLKDAIDRGPQTKPVQATQPSDRGHTKVQVSNANS
ncbi:MAG TPA: hypothetical protein VHS31_00605 [Tepidisphaeraceae bacterium]|jgi:hypothetical protein|nr:hypothetical protein [Tepidisphaeraceae bacterium]